MSVNNNLFFIYIVSRNNSGYNKRISVLSKYTFYEHFDMSTIYG